MSVAQFNVRVFVEGKAATIANMYAANKGVVAEMRHATVKAGYDTHRLAYQFCPKDTWFMANHLRVEFTPEQRGFEVFWDPEDFHAEDLEFYPPFVEFGTFNSPAQPSLGPAFEVMSVHYAADISRAISKALRKAGARGNRRPR